MAATLPAQLSYESLHPLESEGVVRALASIAYVRSQGMALKEGSNDAFIKFVVAEVWPRLSAIHSQGRFDGLHHEWVTGLRQRLRRTRGDERPSYGQGQKSLNVWLKLYVDWASLPDAQTASVLRPWLHCPIDSVVAGALKDQYPDDYRVRIRPHLEGIDYQQHHSLSKMSEPLYREWQSWIRELCPQKPVLIDLVWALGR
jgi:hypothetical protein